jgi:hypothetical protein
MNHDIQWYIDNKLVHSVHTSERRAFRSCRRRWDWTYRRMLYPLVTPEPLEFGVAFHKAMEYYYQPETWHDKETAKQLAMVAFKHSCDTQFKEYKRLNGDPSWETITRYRDRVELGNNMLNYYFEDVAPHYDADWEPVEVEVAFEVPVIDENKNPVFCTCDRCWKRWTEGQRDILGKLPRSEWKGLPVTYGGRLDALFKDEHDRYWIADWKTTSRILDEDKEASFLQLDDQITSYAWSLWSMGIDIAGFVYVEFKKSWPKAPDRLQRPYKGRSFSTNKQNLSTVKIFKGVVEAEDFEAYDMGLYDEYLEWLKTDGPKFTQRHQIHRNANELKNAGINIAYECMDIVHSPRIYPQAGRFSCPTCLFQQPCIGTNMGEDVEYMFDNLFERRSAHYYEERPASTE